MLPQKHAEMINFTQIIDIEIFKNKNKNDTATVKKLIKTKQISIPKLDKQLKKMQLN